MSFYQLSSFSISSLNSFEKIVLDTNVLLFLHGGYVPNSPWERRKQAHYTSFVKQCLTNGFEIVVSVCSLQELFHVIENKEYELHLLRNGLKHELLSKKDFRKTASLRNAVGLKINNIYTQISAYYTVVDADIKNIFISDFASSYSTHLLDPMDFILVNNFSNYSHVLYVTDDGDFNSFSGIDVLTDR